MYVVSVNLASQGPIEINNQVVKTGIFKCPVQERVQANTMGLVGDICPNSLCHPRSKDGGATFVQRFIQAKRPGVYARVLETGDLQVGDSADFLPTPNNFPTVIELYELWHAKKRDLTLLDRGLEAPIAERARTAFQFWLEHR